MNQFIFLGRMCKDADITMSGELKIAKFSFAVDRRHKTEATADFFNLTAFDKTADFIDKYCKQGTKLLITGHIINNNYEKDGKKIFRDSYIVDSCEFCEKKADSPKQNFDTDFANVLDDVELPFS